MTRPLPGRVLLCGLQSTTSKAGVRLAIVIDRPMCCHGVKEALERPELSRSVPTHRNRSWGRRLLLRKPAQFAVREAGERTNE